MTILADNGLWLPQAIYDDSTSLNDSSVQLPGRNTIVANNLITLSTGLSNWGSDVILFFFQTRLKLRNKLKELRIRWHYMRLNI